MSAVQDLVVREKSQQVSVRVCMHVIGRAREDVRALRAATSLVRAGLLVSIFDIESDSTLSERESINGIQLIHLHVPPSFIATRFRRWAFLRAGWLFLRSLLRLVRNSADIYHALDLPALPACYLAAKFRRKPLIFESYELPFSTLRVSDMTRGRYLLQQMLIPIVGYMVPRCAGVIAVSPAIVGEMQRRYGVSKISLVRNILPYQEVSKTRYIHHLLGLAPQTQIALYQGYLQPDRGLDILIRAARFLEPDTVIVLMGKDKLATRSQLEARILAEGVIDRIKIIPEVSYQELLSWTSSADIGLIVYPPDYSQNIEMLLPNKLFEFIMAGLPVLSSQLNEVAEIIKRYDVGLVLPSLEPRVIAAAIQGILSDSVALARMRHNALHIAQQELNWEQEQRHLLSLYSDLFASSNRSPCSQEHTSNRQRFQE